MAHDVFPFFRLPGEIRNMVYGHLINIRGAKALINAPHNPQAVLILFRHIWLSRLLLINKQFNHEYFGYICTNRLHCYVYIDDVIPPTQTAFAYNPGSAIACLAKARTLIAAASIRRFTWSIEDYAARFNQAIPSLLALCPRLKSFQEQFFVQMSCFDEMLARGIDSLLVALHTQDTRFKSALLNNGISGDIAHAKLLYVLAPLCSDIKTRKAEGPQMAVYTARSRVGKEKTEHLWHGFALEAVEAKRVEGKLVPVPNL